MRIEQARPYRTSQVPRLPQRRDRASTTTVERHTVVASTSPASGSCDPTATMVVREPSRAPSNRGVRAVVAQTTTSAAATSALGEIAHSWKPSGKGSSVSRKTARCR
jgi:hypothetical protein